LCESVLVNNTSGVVELLEDRWGDPGFEDEPTTKVDSTDFLISPREGRIAVCTSVNDYSEDIRQLPSAKILLLFPTYGAAWATVAA
jgi:hypothetical protein